MLELFAELGFKTIRMPVLYEWIIDENPPYNTITNEVPFDLFETVIKPVAEQYDQIVLIDNHHGRELTDANFMQEIPRICGQWIFLTQKYIDLPHDQYLFELRNEPKYISNENLRVVQQAIIDSIRNYDTERILIVGANSWNSADSLAQTQPYDDSNIIYTFHSYTPYDFTHQGMSWTNPYIPIGIPFDENGQGATDLRNELDNAKNWSVEHNVPVFWGELGVSWQADEQSRCNYINFAISTANELGIPWLYWDIKNANDAFGIFEDGVIETDNVICCFAEAMELNQENEECGPIENDDNPGGENDWDGDGILNDWDNCPYIYDHTNFCDVDTDGDGILDSWDNCPCFYDQSNACTAAEIASNPNDNDSDGVKNELDNCPDTYDPSNYCDGAGVGSDPNDYDGDGVQNDWDNCPYIYDQTNVCGTDMDGDGILDEWDNCPCIYDISNFCQETNRSANKATYKVFPNPNNGKFLLEIGEQFKAVKQIQVIDIHGKVVELINIDPAAESMITVDFKGYTKGNYLLHIIAGDWVKSQTVVIR